ncbi:hypothetical protein H0H93_009372 [Arthromyces matolae]|nr:hypothetical protein H0H93_009372 [Arthromyces matolae]
MSMSIPHDVTEFLENYPDNDDDEQKSANFEFYSNIRHCQPDNLLIDEIHEQWFGDYSKLEHNHGFIQWLFPIQEYGMNFRSQPLQRHEIESMRANPLILDRVITSYKMMLDFYGMRLVSIESGLVDRSLPPRNFVARYINLVRESPALSTTRAKTNRINTPIGSPHNYLRISRILKSLSEFGFEHLSVGFLLHILWEQSECDKLNTAGIRGSMDRWWANCLRDEAKRERVRDLILQVRDGDRGYVFNRDMYKEEVGVRTAKCVCFLQNNEDSLAALEAELSEPKYGEYYLYFSNILSKTAIERLAEADEYEVVKEVQEYFADYAPLLPCLFSLNHTPTASRPLYGSTPNSWESKALEQTVQGLTAVLLSLKKKPIIRYERMSGMAKKLATEVQHHIRSEASLFDFRLTQVPPLLLILDRRNDPVTPLLSQWTYQAMVHELLGIQNGRVDMKMVPDIRPELAELLLTTNTDPFFQAHYLSTFGDLGTSLKDYVQSYQSRSMAHSPSAINSISDMKKFVEDYPEFRKLGGNVSKHVALVGELSRIVGRDKLLEIGEVEQALATSAGADLRAVHTMISDTSVSPCHKLRLVILYALRYQKTQTNNIANLINLLLANGMSREDARLVYVFLNIAGADQRQDDLFSTESLLAKGRSALKGLKGVENVYTQHTPHLSQTLENIFRGRLKETSYPFVEPPGPNAGLQRPQDIIIFMIGGTTYEEARTVALLNQDPATAPNTGIQNPTGVRLLLGGTCVHNSSSILTMNERYLEMMQSSAASFPSSVYEPPPESASNAPALNLNLGGVNVSLGGPGGTGVFRTNGEGVSVQADGIRDGVLSLFDKVIQASNILMASHLATTNSDSEDDDYVPPVEDESSGSSDEAPEAKCSQISPLRTGESDDAEKKKQRRLVGVISGFRVLDTNTSSPGERDCSTSVIKPPLKRPGPRKSKVTLAAIPTQKAKKLSTLEKSAMDWQAHVQSSSQSGLSDELEANRRGGGYLEKVAFLNRVDERRDDILESSKGSKRRRT